MDNMPLSDLRSLAMMGNSAAIISLANYYYEIGQFDLAFQTISRFSLLEDKDGYRELAKYYEKGIGTAADTSLAKTYYQKAYLLGDYISGYLLAVLLYKQQDYVEAVKYLPLGVYYDYVPSIKMLADFYLKGFGLNKDVNIALNLYKRLVDLGENGYYDTIGRIYYQNKDYYQAVIYFKKGAEVFDMNAVYHLAICYAKGQGVAVDYQKAVSYYEIGARNGHAKCLYNLSVHYDKGIGVTKDSKKAIELLQKYEEISK